MEDKLKRAYKTMCVIFFSLAAIAMICLFLPIDDNFQFLTILILGLFCFTILLEIIVYKRYFLNPKRHIINWTFGNGDRLIVTKWGIVQKISCPHKQVTSQKFGIKWGFDNVKDLAEGTLKNEGAGIITAMFPSIVLTTVSNKVDEVIIFSWGDFVDVYLIDTEFKICLILLDLRRRSKKVMLQFPLFTDASNIKSDVTKMNWLAKSRFSPLTFHYVSKEDYKNIISGIDE